ncbi:50S ribosomal protein L13 [Candidatus Falkowbacteria bacterium CG10_big_fil_rev_8_21_14_0_10_37_14]|uniref:Large ribosomal subunit protein uL13 n=1 Tax=Candidatus Falkowbacteria bacterium CG10_big_fil_rev_8_21_14_0_10_37_14 TaxID=1974561 RepID=A0A2M6WSK5_9BACT|nr:50S ribosomal protein L13 [Candidatus Falkowbacteria bacterium]PIT95754.1 MAG: 50S ribosomal protein L13 [Candidatus Falkowbacteria bacterium CG10_big_fil_rev_8_21_14_0_10_37_14]
MNKPFIRKLIKLDATDKPMGRLATHIALSLRGKNEPEYEPHLDHGAIVEVSNVAKMSFSGHKLDQKVYHHFSGYPGGLKTRKMSDIMAKNPADVLRRAVREMLPDNRLRQPMLNRLNIK